MLEYEEDEWTKEMREATMRNGLLLDQQVKTSEKLRESMTSLINSNNSVVRAQKDMMLQQETANQRVNMLIDTVRNLVDAIKRQSINITPPIQNKVHNSTINSESTSLSNRNEFNASIQSSMNRTDTAAINKLHIKRNYTLNSKMQLDIWLDLLRSELRAHNLLEFIEKDEFPLLLLEDIEECKQSVRDIVTSRLDPYYHKKILNITEPKKLVEKLIEIKRTENNVTRETIRAQLYAMKKTPEMSAKEFVDIFDGLVNEFDNSHVPKMTEDEKTSILFHTVKDHCEQFSTIFLTRQSSNPMSYDEMKILLLQLDTKTPTSGNSEKAPVAQFVKTPASDKCHRCTKPGHWANDCPLKAWNLWFCYTCNDVKKHKSETCPNKTQKYVSDSNNTTNKRTNTLRGRGNGRGRGNFKRNNRYKPYDQPKANVAGESNFTNNNLTNISFIADSGATEHIIQKKELLSEFVTSKQGVIKCANKDSSANIKIDGTGNLTFITSNNEEIKLWNVLAANNVAENLLSLRKFADAGYGVYLDNSELKIFDKVNKRVYIKGTYHKPNWVITCKLSNIHLNRPTNYEVIARLTDTEHLQATENLQVSELGRENSEHEELYIPRKITDLNEYIPENEIEKFTWNDSIYSDPTHDSVGMLWHRRLGHASRDYLIKLQKQIEALKEVKFGKEILDCDICIMAKMERQPFENTRTRSDTLLHTIHTDTMGPITPTSFPDNKRWILVIVDDFSRYAKIFCITNKSESGECLEKFLRETRNLRGKEEKLCFLRSDNGTEFTGGKFAEIIDREKATFDFAPPFTPQLNGTAERFNKTIQNKIRALMFDSGLPETMWSLAADAATYIYNRTPHKSIGFKTPISLMNENIKNNIDKIKRFGCLAYAKILTNTKKFDRKAARGILVGYRPNSSLLWQPNSNRFLILRHVKYNEKVTYRSMKENAQKQSKIHEEVTEQVQEEADEEKNNTEEKSNKEIEFPRAVKRKMEPPTKILPKRAAKSNPRKDPNFVYQATLSEQVKESEECQIYRSVAEIYRDPVTYKSAMNSKESQNWQAAVNEELKSMEENNVWSLVERPPRENIIDSRWVFKRKVSPTTETIYRARLVVRGFKDTNDYEIRETYAPVSRMTDLMVAIVRRCSTWEGVLATTRCHHLVAGRARVEQRELGVDEANSMAHESTLSIMRAPRLPHSSTSRQRAHT
uniref:Endonuclease n=2 Tax=Trichogramma kaykai TaxID=54128 RepID=A0ABD2WAD9_9HYME